MNKKILRIAASLALTLLAPAALQTQAQTVAAAPAGAATARVIVKFKDGSPLLRKQAASAREQHTGQAQALGARVGFPLAAGRGVGETGQVVFASGMTSEALAARLAKESDVEYAQPDRRKRIVAAPNDPLYTTGGVNGPAVGQWYLRAPDTTIVSAINAEAAWAVTTGSSSVIVAVIDTGVRFDHPDLAANLLPGRDMITDIPTSNDGNARDADASDPGDFLTQADIDSGNFAGACTSADIGDSSWHGTQTSGLIGAITNNGVGMASVGRNVKVLPVRVLGKCGGFDSDIIAGMRWAAGIAVDGNTNPNPAKVLNLSLGGGTTCSTAYSNAVTEIVARGVTIVASAGNSEGHAVSEPASCSGVIAVAGLRHAGTKVGFSDIGPEVSIAAPGGNCVNDVGACLYPILTTSNSGTTTPVAAPAGAIYTGGGANASIGTSFSAPLVSATAALMLSSNRALTPAQIRAAIQANARGFPSTGGSTAIPACVVPTSGSAAQDECYCNTQTCGAGMLDTGAAVAAVAVLQSHVSFSPAKPTAGDTVTVSSVQSSAASGRTIVLRQWSLIDAGTTGAALTVAADSLTATVTTTSAGRFSVGLTVTDGNQATDASVMAIDVAAASSGGGGGSGSGSSDGGGGGALGAGWLLLLLAAVLALARREPRHRGA